MPQHYGSKKMKKKSGGSSHVKRDKGGMGGKSHISKRQTAKGRKGGRAPK